MSFGSGGFGGFGQNNNQTNNQPSTGFGGFGANNNNNNTSAGFGATNTSFGSNNNTTTTTGGGMFGSATNNNPAGGFGSGGFGANTTSTNTGFGARPAFGAATNTPTGGGGLFGSAANTNTGASTFGGFGNAANNSNTTTATGSNMFGSNNTAPKTGFGATGGSLFGGASNTTPGFGGGGGGFGVTTNPGLGAVGDPPGTGGTPFQAFTENEPNSTANNSFQNIVFQDPYKKWSPEELRLVDYAQGRRHGNATGAGAFGVSSGFGGGLGQNSQQQTTGGFGATGNAGSSLFGGGNNNTTTSGFGQAAAGGFGSGTPNTNTTGGGLFGAKPAATGGGGLFGASSTTGQQPQQSGGLFGAANSGTGFGATNNTTNTTGGFGSSTTGGGLFGNNNNQAKPAGGLFGGATNTTSGFGSNASSNPFGAQANPNTTNSTGGGLFGSANNAQPAGGGLFGNNNNQQQAGQQNTTGGFGGFGQAQNNTTGGGLFGNNNNNQQKPGGLFGQAPAATTGGGLFGNSTNQQPGAQSGFGAANNTGSSLFGAKPATGGLFGNTQNQQTTNAAPMGLNTQNQQGGGLFGSANNQQKPSLFGGSTQQQSTGLFGGGGQQTNSPFGSNQQQQPMQNSMLGNSLLGNSQQAANSGPQGLTANLNDVSAYGSASLFSNTGPQEAPNPGPLAVPLDGTPKPGRRGSILPLHKLAPQSASRRGYGFNYSNFNTPGGSPASSISSTPGGFQRSLLGGGGSLSKSMSTNNLRRSFNTEDNILAPGAFSSSSSGRWYGSTGGSKKLVINRDIRSDLFSTPKKDKAIEDANSSARKLNKRVSFDTSNVDGDAEAPLRALPAPEEAPRAEETPRQVRPSTETPISEAAASNGKELAIVHEEDRDQTPSSANVSGFDHAPGEYYSEPSLEALEGMNRMQRQRVDGFMVGRVNVGTITFKVPVDLSAIDLSELCGGVIQLEPRSATVYPVSAKKPPVGKGLNVPARIMLEQSWPRGRDRRMSSGSKRYSKHVEKLKKIPDTTFESYNGDTGTWSFSVEHFTTYGLDDDDDSDDDMDITADGPPSLQINELESDHEGSSLPDDTFDFKTHRGFPGAFDHESVLGGDAQPAKPSFLGASSADLTSHDVRLSVEDDQTDDMDDEYDLSDDEDATGSSIGQHLAAEHDDISSEGDPEPQRGTPGGILRARMRAMKESAGPTRLEVADGDDWMEMLRKTVSPAKRDRQFLKEANESMRHPGMLINFDKSEEEGDPRNSTWKSRPTPSQAREQALSAKMNMDKGRGFATSIDLMNSLFEKPKPMAQSLRASTSAKGFPKWPYERQEKTLTIEEGERAFHDAPRPTWGPDDTLVFMQRSTSTFGGRDSSDILSTKKTTLQTSRQQLRIANYSTESSKKILHAQHQLTDIAVTDGVPKAMLHTTSLDDMYLNEGVSDSANAHEKRVWALASILFDKFRTRKPGVSDEERRLDALCEFWTDLVDTTTSKSVGLAGSSEEKAVACLAGHRIPEACKHLLDGSNFRLGTLVALIGTSDAAKKEMKDQLKAWYDSKMLSEFSEPIRTIYELLAGNVCACQGLKNAPVQDRMDSFVISKKFGLDWKQSFGLRFWYGLAKSEDLSVAVRNFRDDISQDREDAPRPWYLEQGLVPTWNDTALNTRQDLLWGLLQLYADDASADVEAILRPENSQLSPLDTRLTWQLSLALSSSGAVSYDTDKMNTVTISYASQLSSGGEWLEAIFVLLHLSDSKARARAIQEQLCRHAGLLGNEDSPDFGVLTEKFCIPRAWVFEALALYKRSVEKDPIGEVRCLLRAGAYVEAHRVIVQQVAPVSIVERDFDTLQYLLSQFDGHHDSITSWPVGGEVYSLFIELLQHKAKRDPPPALLLEKLLAGLHAMDEDAPEDDVMRYAAVSDMADQTAREVLKIAHQSRNVDLGSRILSLPLTQDRLLAYSVDLGLGRFREVLTH